MNPTIEPMGSLLLVEMSGPRLSITSRVRPEGHYATCQQTQAVLSSRASPSG